MNCKPDESCVVCIEDIKIQDSARIVDCNHEFHMHCITRWVKIKNNCPLCNTHVSALQYKKRIIPVEDKEESPDEPSEFLESLYCQVCGTGLDEEILLLCDNCNLGFHIYCMDPPLNSVPTEDWFCPACQPMLTCDSSDIKLDLSDDATDILHNEDILSSPRSFKAFSQVKSQELFSDLHDSDFEGQPIYKAIVDISFDEPDVKRSRIPLNGNGSKRENYK